MAYIKVEYAPMTRVASDLLTIAGVLRRSSETVQHVRSNLDWDVSCEENIDRRLANCSTEIESIIERLKKTSTMLEEAVRLYQQVDEPSANKNPIAGTAVVTASQILQEMAEASSQSAVDRINNSLKENFDLTLESLAGKFLSKYGQAGLITDVRDFFKSLGKLVDNTSENQCDAVIDASISSLKAIIGGGKKISEISKIVKNAKLVSRFHNTGSQYALGSQANDYAVKKLLGLDKYKAILNKGGHVIKPYIGMRNDLFKAEFAKSFKGTGGLLTLLDLVGNLHENYVDYRDGNNGVTSIDRAVVEGVTETGFGITYKALSTAAVQEMAINASADLTTVGAGVATAGVMIAGEAASYYLTGDSLSDNAGFVAGMAWDGLIITGSTFKNAGFRSGMVRDGLKITGSTLENAGFRSGMVRDGLKITASTLASESLPEAAATLTKYADAGFKEMGGAAATLTNYADAGFKQMGKAAATLTNYADAGFKQMGKNLVTFAKVKGSKIAEDVSKITKWTFDYSPAGMMTKAAQKLAADVAVQIKSEPADPGLTEKTRQAVAGGVRNLGVFITIESSSGGGGGHRF